MGGIFISYRRGDSEGQARALSLELANYIGDKAVFMDVDSIALGRDFRQSLHDSLESCDAFLALIGPNWLDSKDAAGKRRLDDPTDFVRQEIATALKRNIPVTPVLLQGAPMPAEQSLPDDLKDLAFRNGFELSHTRWRSDVGEMVQRLGLGAPPPRRPRRGRRTPPNRSRLTRRLQFAPARRPNANVRSPRCRGEALADAARGAGRFRCRCGCGNPGDLRALYSAMGVGAAEAGAENNRLRLCDRRRERGAHAGGEGERVDLHRDAGRERRLGHGVDPGRRLHHGLAEIRTGAPGQRGSATLR